MISAQFRKRLRDYELVVSLEVPSGKCLALVGPTGCGKTMTLRTIAGLEAPDEGRVVMDDTPLADTARGIFLSPQRRQVGMVFQDFALFPHLSVLQNVMYGARARRNAERNAEEVARGALATVHLSGVERLRPTQLSGGQQQRVALARALASGARAFLMDEPMSALDAATRRAVRTELKQLITELGIQTIIVTHDVVDALTLGDRICVMNQGRIVQEGTRRELQSRPRDLFVAEFLGVNLLSGVASRGANGLCEVRCGDLTLYSVDQADGEVMVTCAPWDVSLSLQPPTGSAQNVLRGRVSAISHLGGRTRVTVDNGISLTAEITHASEEELGLQVGSEVYASFKAAATRVYS